jgi:large subunit ribosomal protein L46
MIARTIPRMLGKGAFLSRSFATTIQPKAPLVSSNYRIVSGVVLSRTPQITRDSTPFEKAYFDYSEKLERQAAAPLASDFYFKKGSLAERRWKEDEEARKKAMADPQLSLTDAVKEAQSIQQDEESVTPLSNKFETGSRETEADKKNDIKSLDRALQRTLYLIVKKPRDQHAWQFPQGAVEDGEYLHDAAERELAEECGKNMDVWFVGRQPIGHYTYKFSEDHVKKNPGANGAKVFFMKAHVFAGQCNPDNKEVVDFAWVTKDELPQYVSPEYFDAVKDILSDL